MRPRAFLLVLVALWGGGLSVLEAVSVLPSLEFTPGSGVSMKLTSYYDQIPPCGYLPLRVEVKNGDGAPHRWVLRTEHVVRSNQRMDFATEIRVNAGDVRTFEILVPLVSQGNRHVFYSHLNVRITGYGVVDGSSSMYSNRGSGSPTRFFGMGEELAVPNWGLLENELKKTSSFLAGTSLDGHVLPSDWRGLAGFGVLLFTAGEWRTISPGSRAALFDWVSQGGRLLLAHDRETGPTDLPPEGPWGAGTIGRVPTDDLINRLRQELDGDASLAEVIAEDYSWTWEPAAEVGRLKPPNALILLAVVAFAITVGPVNFLVFASGVHRSRLFWTTPLIAVVATLLMGLFILISEGVGGRGKVFVALLTMADQKKSVLWQEQVSRTGVLFGTSFTPSEATALLLPIQLKEDGRPGRHYSPWSERNRTYALDANRWSGDWFRSRQTQAQLVMTVEPSRGQFVFDAAADGTPTVTSTFEREMTGLWYFDASGQPWTVGKIAPGETVSLTRAEKSVFDQWFDRALKPAGALTRERVQGFAKAGLPGKFFAAIPEPVRIATLPTIRWEDAGGVVFGRALP